MKKKYMLVVSVIVVLISFLCIYNQEEDEENIQTEQFQKDTEIVQQTTTTTEEEETKEEPDHIVGAAIRLLLNENGYDDFIQMMSDTGFPIGKMFCRNVEIMDRTEEKWGIATFGLTASDLYDMSDIHRREQTLDALIKMRDLLQEIENSYYAEVEYNGENFTIITKFENLDGKNLEIKYDEKYVGYKLEYSEKYGDQFKCGVPQRYCYYDGIGTYCERSYSYSSSSSSHSSSSSNDYDFDDFYEDTYGDYEDEYDAYEAWDEMYN